MARKEKNIHYVYKTTCNVTGRWYVGMHSTSNLEDGYMGSGLRIRRSIRKYGPENHTKEILEFLPTKEALVLREIEIINKELIADNNCMNLKEGGTGGWVSKEVQLKCSIAGGYAISEKLKNDDIFRTNFSNVISNALKEQYKDKTRSGFSGTRFNQLHSEETKELMSEQRKGTGVGETNSQYGTCWITKDGVNKKIKKEEFEIYQLEGWVKGRK
jgi:hypothetical protein